MTITTITFQQTFPTGQFANQKLGIEIEVPDFHPSTGESNVDKAMDAFMEAKRIVGNAFKAMNPHLYTEGEQKQEEVAYGARLPVIPPNVAAIINDIGNCIAINEKNKWGQEIGLSAYESVANADPEIKAAYDLKYQSLQNK